jgi:hypothetical protein
VCRKKEKETSLCEYWTVQQCHFLLMRILIILKYVLFLTSFIRLKCLSCAVVCVCARARARVGGDGEGGVKQCD